VARIVPREPRRSAHSRGYTRRWSRAAKAFRLQYPLCGMRPEHTPPVMSMCFLEHRTTPATLVDHVVPHRGDDALFWDEANWQSMCDPCHSRKTQYEETDVNP
jgi:5-methylcytosine-specific restriction protein A